MEKSESVEIMTQPDRQEKQEKSPHNVLNKLKDLMDEERSEDDQEEEANDSEDKPVADYGSDNESFGSSCELEDEFEKEREGETERYEAYVHDDMNNEDNGNVKYDDDGFEIPRGKIPIDGHFTTEEVKYLISLSKDEGILSKDIDVKIQCSNDAVGDKLQIFEERSTKEAHYEEPKDDNPDMKDISRKLKQSRELTK